MRGIQIAPVVAVALMTASPAATQINLFGTRINSTVSGFADGASVTGQKYFLAPAEEQEHANPFEFREYARHVERALSTQGMVRMTEPKAADMIVIAPYGIGAPKVERGTRLVPVWGQLPRLALLPLELSTRWET